VELCPKITKKKKNEENWGFGGDWVFSEKEEMGVIGQPTMGGGGAVVVMEVIGGIGIWILGSLGEER
jgi:hypothetical protein